MGVFLFAAMALLAFTMVSLLRPWRRAELQPARGLTLGLVIALPLAATGLYALLGTPGAVVPEPPRPQAAAPGGAQHTGQMDVEAMVAKLAARLDENPANPQGWAMLLRSYQAMGKVEEMQAAVVRMAQAMKRIPPDTEEARVMGDMLKQLGAYDHAPGDVPAATAAGATAPATPSRVAAAKPAAGGAAVTGQVVLSPKLAAQAKPDDTVFVLARGTDGSRIPLAVQRARVADLPLQFKLDDSLAMSPDHRISGVPEVRIEARVSRSGNAMPAPGDLYAEVAVVKTGSSGVKLQIDSVRQ